MGYVAAALICGNSGVCFVLRAQRPARWKDGIMTFHPFPQWKQTIPQHGAVTYSAHANSASGTNLESVPAYVSNAQVVRASRWRDKSGRLYTAYQLCSFKYV